MTDLKFTTAEIDTMPASRRLDALISELVMDSPVRWQPSYSEDGARMEDVPITVHHLERNEQRRQAGQPLVATWSGGDVPQYSSDTEAAWRVVEKMRKGWHFALISRGRLDGQSRQAPGWRAEFSPYGPDITIYQGDVESGETYAPEALAICRAALKARLFGGHE